MCYSTTAASFSAIIIKKKEKLQCNSVMDSGQQWRKSAPVIANITRPSWMWFIIIAYMRTPVGMWQVGGLALVGGEVGRRRRSEEGMLRRAKCGKTGWQKSWMKKSKIQSLRFWWWCQTMSRGGYAAVSGAGVWKGVSNKKKGEKKGRVVGITSY